MKKEIEELEFMVYDRHESLIDDLTLRLRALETTMGIDTKETASYERDIKVKRYGMDELSPPPPADGFDINTPPNATGKPSSPGRAGHPGSPPDARHSRLAALP